ncbi:TetR-like C-terminal domain-containing protein [Aureimonas psammosilenae]|uniref:TetR-like C-terminal domain-containing protein n=1 Tax=Aureimonas psammosilenae TaxID=2495496 RepID=UPI0012608385|nr:TetR-like C-terminal domain-containing protein [Aureimonas psammosilenae]
MRQPMIRPGGRSERIQIAVHRAVKALLEEDPDRELTLPMVAQAADVTPSTIYRRWGTVGQLVADVAAGNLRADPELADTGSLRGDLEVWLERFVDDMATGLGRSLIQERVADLALAKTVAGYPYANFLTLIARADARGEAGHDPDRLMDLLVAPVIYRFAFADQLPDKDYQLELVDLAMRLDGEFRSFKRQQRIQPS